MVALIQVTYTDLKNISIRYEFGRLLHKEHLNQIVLNVLIIFYMIYLYDGTFVNYNILSVVNDDTLVDWRVIQCFVGYTKCFLNNLNLY